MKSEFLRRGIGQMKTRWRPFILAQRNRLRFLLGGVALVIVGDAFVSERSLQHLLVGHTAAILLLCVVAAVIEWRGND